jgi:uncharacterized protein (DUF58 family)
MPRLTSRGVAVLAVAAVCLGVGQWLGYPVLRALGGAAVGAVLAALVVTARRPRVAVSREVYPDRVGRGRPAFARLRVDNPGTRRQGELTAGDRVGTGFQAVAVRALAPGAQAVYHYELPTGRRGRFEVGPLTLRRADPLGLSRSSQTTGGTTTLWVHPRVHPVRELAGGRPRHHHEGRSSDDPLHGSLDLREVREYVVGDEVRHLHWKATARTGQLMVREYTDPEQPRFTVLLDTRAPLTTPAIFEEAVDLAGSLLSASALAGHHCRLVTPGSLDVSERGGPAAVRRLLDELCQLSPDKSSSLVSAELARGGGRGGGHGGGLAVVLAGALAADLASLAALRRHYATTVVMVLGGGVAPTELPGGQRAVEVDVPGARVLRVGQAREAARRWNAVVAG